MRIRIVAGTLGGRRFAGPTSEATRPTSERVREAVASALSSRGVLDGARVLDLYAGTGALAFEALSRGAKSAVLVERDKQAVLALRASVGELGLGARTQVEALDLAGPHPAVLARLARHAPPAFDLVFADPPYADVDRVPALITALFDAGLVAPHALVVLEHARKRPPARLGKLAQVAAYEYGDTAIAFVALAFSDEAPQNEP